MVAVNRQVQRKRKPLTPFRKGYLLGLLQHESQAQVSEKENVSHNTLRCILAEANLPDQPHLHRRRDMDHRKKRSKRYSYIRVLQSECKRVAYIRKVATYYTGKKQKEQKRTMVPYATAPQIRRHLINLQNNRIRALQLKSHADRKKAKREHPVPSVRSIQRHLRAMKLKPQVRPRVPFTPENKAARLAFCNSANFKDPEYVKRIHFSDEHYVTANDNSNRIMWVADKKDLVAKEIKSKHNTYNAQLWAMIGYNYKSPLIWVEFEEEVEFFDKKQKKYRKKKIIRKRLNGDNYIKHVLKDKGITARLKKKGTIFMQDGASSHTCKKTKAHLRQMRIDFINNWPSHSPDLNPIEQVWKLLNERITMNSDKVPSSVAELRQRAEEEWAALDQETINNFVMSFMSKCATVVRNKGGSAKR